MSCYLPARGMCSEAGPYSAHCSEVAGHRYSCYDATDDTSWNDGQYADGWYDNAPHHCGDARCPGRTMESSPVQRTEFAAPFKFGKPHLATCCGKPAGCTNRDPGTCVHPDHAWKQRQCPLPRDGDLSAPSCSPGEENQQ